MPESEATIGWRIKKRLGRDSNGDNYNNSNSNNNHLHIQYSGEKDTTKESNKLTTTPTRIMKSNGNDTNDNSNNQSKYSRKDKKFHNKIEGGHSSSCSCSSATCGSCCCSNTVGTIDTRRSSTGSVSVDVPLGSEDGEYDDHDNYDDDRGENYIDKRFNNNSSNATTTTNNNNGNNSSLSASVLNSCSASSPLQSSSLSTVTCFSTTSSSSHQRRRRSCRSRRRSRSRSCSRSSIGSLHSIDSCTTTTTSISGSANSSWNGMDTDKDCTDHEKCLQSNNNNTCSDYYQLQQHQHQHQHQHQEKQSQQQKQKQFDWFTTNNICCRINNWYCRTNNRTITLLFGTIGIYTSFVLHGNIQEELFLYRSFHHHHHNHHHKSDGKEEEPEAFTYVWLLQVLESIASIILGLIGSYIWTQHEHHSKQQQHQKQYPTLSSSLVTDSDTMVNVTATTSATTTESTTTEQTKTTRKLPIGTLFCVGMTQVLSKGCTCLALSTGVSYPVCTITKCGKIIPVMIGQLLLGGSKYTMKDYIFCILIVSGITLVSYNTSENDTSKESTPSSVSNRNDRNSKVGLIFLFLSLVLDGCTAGLQKRMQQQQQPDERKHQQQQQQEHYHHYQQEDESNPSKVDSTNVTTRVNIVDGSNSTSIGDASSTNNNCIDREYDNSNNVVNNNHDDDNTNTTKKGLMIPQNTKQPEADMILYQTPTMYDFLLYSHCSMLVVALWISIMTNEFIPGILYSMYNPMIRSLLVQVCICSVIGQGFIFYIITKFDTYVCTAITTTRKLVSIGISIVVHGHVIPQSGYIGMILVGTALLLELEYKKNSK